MHEENAMQESMTTTSYTPDRTTIQILSALSRGAGPSDAAAASNVSSSTMRRKLSEIRDEWGVVTNIQVVVLAMRRGLI
jgi:DNA-binding NarL/FixJ family response regulator